MVATLIKFVPFIILEDEKAGGYLDNEATAAMDVPTELESAYVHKEDVQGVNKCSAEVSN